MLVLAKVTSLPLASEQLDGRTQLLAAALLGIEHHGARQSRDLIDLRGHRQAVDEVLELDEAGDLGHHRVGMRIPGGHDLAARDARSFLGGDGGAIGNLVALALTTELVDHADLARARHRHQVTLLVLDRLDVMEAQRALVADLDVAGCRGPRGRTTDVEGTHRQLRAGLADRLRRDHADRLADVDQPAARQIAPVALASTRRSASCR